MPRGSGTLWMIGVVLGACSAPSPPGSNPPTAVPEPKVAEIATARTSPEPGVPADTGVRTDTAGSPVTTSPAVSPDAGAPVPFETSKDRYPWLDATVTDTVYTRFAPPRAYRREPALSDSFTAWLRHLPLLPGRPDVMLFNGEKKGNQTAHEAVVDIDVGGRDLQQCADAVMRLRAEYLRTAGKEDKICFRFTNGRDAVWRSWRSGERPRIEGNRVTWRPAARANSSYRTFRKYLTKVFQYAGSASLEKELRPVPSDAPIAAGDVFIEGGFPGHAVMVVDVARNAAGDQVYIIVQSYMPAQQMHVLRNPGEPALSPWYRYVPGAAVATPEWHFDSGTLRRFTDRRCDP